MNEHLLDRILKQILSTNGVYMMTAKDQFTAYGKHVIIDGKMYKTLYLNLKLYRLLHVNELKHFCNKEIGLITNDVGFIVTNSLMLYNVRIDNIMVNKITVRENNMGIIGIKLQNNDWCNDVLVEEI